MCGEDPAACRSSDAELRADQLGQGHREGNHYHQTDWHFCYVLSGSIEYHHRPHGSDKKPEKSSSRRDNVFYAADGGSRHGVSRRHRVPDLGRNSRAQEVYEADVVRIPPIHE